MNYILFGTLTRDLRDETGDTDWRLPAGTVVAVLSDEGDYFICEHADISFPVDKTCISVEGQGNV